MSGRTLERKTVNVFVILRKEMECSGIQIQVLEIMF